MPLKGVLYFFGIGVFEIIWYFTPILGRLINWIPVGVLIFLTGVLAWLLTDVGTEGRSPMYFFRSLILYHFRKMKGNSYYRGREVAKEQSYRFHSHFTVRSSRIDTIVQPSVDVTNVEKPPKELVEKSSEKLTPETEKTAKVPLKEKNTKVRSDQPKEPVMIKPVTTIKEKKESVPEHHNQLEKEYLNKSIPENSNQESKERNTVVPLQMQKEKMIKRKPHKEGRGKVIEPLKQKKSNKFGVGIAVSAVLLLGGMFFLFSQGHIGASSKTVDIEDGKVVIEEELVNGLRAASIQKYEEATESFDKIDFKGLGKEDKNAVLFSYLLTDNAQKALQLDPKFDKAVVSYYLAKDEMSALKDLDTDSKLINYEVAVINEDYEQIIQLQDDIELDERRSIEIVNAYLQLNQTDDALAFAKKTGDDSLILKIEEKMESDKKKEEKKESKDKEKKTEGKTHTI